MASGVSSLLGTANFVLFVVTNQHGVFYLKYMDLYGMCICARRLHPVRSTTNRQLLQRNLSRRAGAEQEGPSGGRTAEILESRIYTISADVANRKIRRSREMLPNLDNMNICHLRRC